MRGRNWIGRIATTICAVLIGSATTVDAQDTLRLDIINPAGSFESPDPQTLDIESIDSGTFDLNVFLDNNDNAIESWAYGVCHDPNLFTITSTIDRAQTLEIGFIFPPSFSTQTIFPDGFIHATVISLTDMFQLPVDADVVLATASYELEDVSGISNGTSTIDICDTLNSPPTISLITPDELAPTEPTVEPIDITLTEVSFAVVITECSATATEVTLSWTDENPNDGVQRFAFYAVARDGDFIDIFDPELETGMSPAEDGEITFIDTNVVPGETYFYNVLGVSFPDPMGPAVTAEDTCSVMVVAVELFDVQPPNGFFYGGDEVTLTGMGFESAATLDVVFGTNAPVAATIVDDTTATVITPDNMAVGAVDVTAQNPLDSATLTDAYTFGFVRGDFDCDGEIGLSDGIDLLSFLFSAGDPPCCLDAVDTNDSGNLTIDDTVQLFNFLFSGIVNIAPPFPAMPMSNMLQATDAGLDPTDDDGLTCP